MPKYSFTASLEDMFVFGSFMITTEFDYRVKVLTKKEKFDI